MDQGYKTATLLGRLGDFGRKRHTTIFYTVSGPEMAKTHKARKLPVQQLTVLALCRFAEPIAFSSVYVYEVPLPSQTSIH